MLTYTLTQIDPDRNIDLFNLINNPEVQEFLFQEVPYNDVGELFFGNKVYGIKCLGEVIGMIDLCPVEHIVSYALLPGRRGRGLITWALLEVMKAENIQTVTADVDRRNEPGIRFAEAIGKANGHDDRTFVGYEITQDSLAAKVKESDVYKREVKL